MTGRDSLLRNAQWTAWKDRLITCGILCFIAVVLSPTINCPMVSDDGVYYFLRGHLAITHETLWQYARTEIFNWINRGRFFPLSVYSLVVFYYFSSVTAYRLLFIVTICFSVWLFGILMREMTGSRQLCYFSMLGMGLMFQVVTNYHSSILSFHMFMPIMMSVLLGTLIFLQRYLTRGKKFYLALSLVCYTAGLLLYEVAFTYIAIAGCLIWYSKKKFWPSVKTACIYLPSLGAVGAINVWVKMHYSSGYEGITVSIKPAVILQTLAKQSVAALPLSNYLFTKNNTGYSHLPYPYSIGAFLQNLTVRDLLLATLFVVLMVYLLRTTQFDWSEKVKDWRFLLFAVSLWLCPGCLIAVSAKYQSELYWGVAHISVYLAWFGMLLVLLWLSAAVYRLIVRTKPLKHKTAIWMKSIVTIALAMVLVLEQQNMRIAIQQTQAYWRFPKAAYAAAADSQLLAQLPEGATLVSMTDYEWNGPTFYTEYSHIVLNCISRQQLGEEVQEKGKPEGQEILWTPDRPLWAIYYSGTDSEYFATLGKIDTVRYRSDTQEITDVLVSDLSIYTTKGETTAFLYRDAEGTQKLVRSDAIAHENYFLWRMNNADPVELDSLDLLTRY